MTKGSIRDGQCNTKPSWASLQIPKLPTPFVLCYPAGLVHRGVLQSSIQGYSYILHVILGNWGMNLGCLPKLPFLELHASTKVDLWQFESVASTLTVLRTIVFWTIQKNYSESYLPFGSSDPKQWHVCASTFNGLHFILLFYPFL